METLWFALVALMIAGYVVLDGFDIGAGILHLFVGKSDREKRQIIQSIGPVWDGNEVWLIAGGGVLFFAFPKLYASSFAGFYLPLTVVLWLLIFRALSIELRNHVNSPVWTPFWDVAFTGSSALLAVFFGAALGNVIRGVPLDGGGDFFLPFWTHFGVDGDVGILDWYTIVVAILAFLTLAMHGALWLVYKTEGALQERASRWARRSLVVVALLTALVTAASFNVQPQLQSSFSARPWGYVFPALALAGLAGVFRFAGRAGGDLRAFLASCLYIVGMLASAAFGIFPYVLPSNAHPEAGLTIYNAAAAERGLKIGLAWWIPGMALALAYFVYTYRWFAGKVTLDDTGH
ncbi:MAG: cytochrome d ubiquinol oxidase subunit II [Bryobacteraceae bacterium]|nr:cytochrome d ubiquinol oxidase subunit II [Bryobacteraceae bacterium]